MLGGQDMVMPSIDWNKVEEIAETNPVLRQKLNEIAAFDTGSRQDDDQAKALLLAHEGDKYDSATQRHYVYKDVENKDTIGFGHLVRGNENFAGGITNDEALELFDKDFEVHKEVLFAELALNEGSLFANSSHSEAGNNWQYAFLNSTKDNIKYIDGGEPSVTAKSNGNTTIRGFDNREELLAAGQARYEQMPTNVQAAVLSVTYNYGSTGPQTIRLVNEAIDSGNYADLANHYRTNLAKENQGKLAKRRRDEADLINTGQSVQVRESAEMQGGTLNMLGIENVFAGQNAAVFDIADEGRVLNEARTAGGSPSVFMTPAQIAQSRQFNLPAADYGVAAEGVQEIDAENMNPQEAGSYLDFFIDQYGGYGLLLGDENNPQFDIGLVYSGGNLIRTVPANSPEADQVINIIDYIDQNGITSDSIIFGLLQKTEWWMSTDSAARAFDIAWSEMSEPEKQEYLEPLMKVLRRKADQLGFVYDENDLYEKAQTIMRLGNDDDEEFLNKFVLADSKQASIVSDATDFGSLKDSVFALADKYLLPLNDDDVIPLAEQLFTGDLTDAELQQEFKNRAVGLFPTMQKVIQELGITPKQYFSSHIAEIETLLERPIDFKREFLDVVEHVDADGNVRPKTLSETRKRVRKTGEWQSSQNAEDEAREVAAVIGEVFGKVAY